MKVILIYVKYFLFGVFMAVCFCVETQIRALAPHAADILQTSIDWKVRFKRQMSAH